MDRAHKITDEMLEKAEKQIETLYKAAQTDAKKQLVEILSKVESAETPQERYNNALKYDRLAKLKESIANTIQEANKEAILISQSLWVDTYDVNYKYGAYLVETGTNNVGAYPFLDKRALTAVVKGEFTPFTLMALDNIKDKAQIIRNLTTQLVTGIMLGESNQQMARRIQANVTEKNYWQSLRIARTETTRIQNAGRNDAFIYGRDKLGFDQEKEWVSTLDRRTRHSHSSADGQRVKIDKNFKVGSATGQYPGDMSTAGENINCRCTVVTHIKGFEELEEKRMTYEEWEATKRD